MHRTLRREIPPPALSPRAFRAEATVAALSALSAGRYAGPDRVQADTRHTISGWIYAINVSFSLSNTSLDT